jgi:hypothetical protein
MGIFPTNVHTVGATDMFACQASEGRQFLAFSFRYEADSDFTLIWPLPTPPSSVPNAARFIDLSSYNSFFHDLRRGFPSQARINETPGDKPSIADRVLSKVRDWLDIDTVSAEIAFMPNRATLTEMQDRFRVPDELEPALDRYVDYGFVCLRLQAGTNRLPPMAFEFPRRWPGELFFPTALAVSQLRRSEAWFDYALFCQTHHRPPNWQLSSTADGGYGPIAAREFVKVERTAGLIDPQQPVWHQQLHGPYANIDLVIPDTM